MQFSYKELNLVKHTLTTTGLKEPGQDGKEQDAPRLLNGEESSQRRHFTKNTEEVMKKLNDKIKELSDVHNKLVKDVKEEIEKSSPNIKKLVKEWEKRQSEEKDEDKKEKDLNPLDVLASKDSRIQSSFKNIQEEVEKLTSEKHEVELSGKTLDVVKKYFKEFGDKVGFRVGDDEVVSELQEVLK